MKMTTAHYIIAVLVLIIVAAGSFSLGMHYQKSNANGSAAQMYGFRGGANGGPGGAGGRFGGRNGMGAVLGKVSSVNGNSMTVTMSDGSSKIVQLTNSTKYTKSESGSTSDLTNGTTVAVIGTTNSDGSETATTVQINPPQRPGGNGGVHTSPSPAQ